MTLNNNFEQYFAFGDSMGIDIYARRELEERGIFKSKVGAVSLLHRNDDELYPEFQGRDLASLFPGLIFSNSHNGVHPEGPDSHNLTVDGAHVSDVAVAVRSLAQSNRRTLITLTIGGNDFLGLIQSATSAADLTLIGSATEEIVAKIDDVVQSILDKFTNGHLLLSTVYDPSDGTVDLMNNGRPEPMVRAFDDLNDGIRAIAANYDRVTLSDLNKHFLGHGVNNRQDCWFYAPLPIEPSSTGSSEIRKVWLEAIESLNTNESE